MGRASRSTQHQLELGKPEIEAGAQIFECPLIGGRLSVGEKI